ncbi:hypothetical protein TVAG_332530 [Trichomonas vaginalis G3]|uniref:Uncharacterized protein n=1 Tax=Trichomonas vaginalis (strain ATCC PRA-98 / G3) TaxID=412133 RepID=A2FAC6_TRIV3|nr:hypothetical protein TVAGG3_0916760 [Trichomonas vaginalis G3]EAX98143.1 hypothetical protein TVAG_332530 [Trichomonas vaginalis G3]KAI5484859.1 hypothetical protein TVAGG3_0916760 [Trichomonas vaginalis G3]|eukprot:XP_001311073.1 hypothetical protein [Trichomonas vaginalis G3]
MTKITRRALLDFKPTPITIHRYQEGAIVYGIEKDNNLIFNTEDQLDEESIENYWYNVEVIKLRDQLPFSEGELIKFMKSSDSINLILRTDNYELPFLVISNDVAYNKIKQKYIDFLVSQMQQ